MPEWPCEGRFKISVRYANTRLGINYESRNVARPLRCAGVFAAPHITYATRPKATLHSRLLSWLRGLRNENNAKPVSVSWLRYVWLLYLLRGSRSGGRPAEVADTQMRCNVESELLSTDTSQLCLVFVFIILNHRGWNICGGCVCTDTRRPIRTVVDTLCSTLGSECPGSY